MRRRPPPRRRLPPHLRRADRRGRVDPARVRGPRSRGHCRERRRASPQSRGDLPQGHRLRACLRRRQRTGRNGGPRRSQPERIAMLERLASFVHRNRRRVLLVALVGVAVAGVFGLGVAKRLSPYGDTDPSTQSVQAKNRYEAATGRQIDPGVIALVTTGDVHSAAAERRVREVEAKLRASRDIATVSSYYDSHDTTMVSRDGSSTYVVAYFRPKSDSRVQD